MTILAQLVEDLAAFRITSRRVVEECLARIQAPDGEGVRVFLKVHAETALTAADYHDRMRKAGAAVSPFAGIPVSIKDLFDIAGDVTTAGSPTMVDAPPASTDAVCVARLRAAGFIPIGRSNMTEFAFSGLGLNKHYGTPANPHDRKTRRIPGGSSSGAAVSVTDQMAHAGLGTDTGGSCRIPAALCGIVGFKPTARRVPLQGTYPLSTSLDSIGPLARSVQCCAILDAVLAGEPEWKLPDFPLKGLRFAVPKSFVLEDLEPTVARSFSNALSALSEAGAQITNLPLLELLELPSINLKGGLSAPEAYALHRERIGKHAAGYDPRVLSRILRGKEQDAADYLQLLKLRVDFIRRVTAATAPFDAMLMPTTPIVAPPIAALEQDEEYVRFNMLALRNPSVVNFLDGCAISIPCHDPGDLPVGLMIVGAHGADRRLLAIAAAIEKLGVPRALLASN
jgi:aspartyl-tRNA(Asn)/glutamyl-tRNA(Gln) amidotransferase subunit A